MKAFPNPNNTTQEGMDLRDWFAGLAMQALIQTEDFDSLLSCKASWDIADAMIATRNNKPKYPKLEDLNLTKRIKNVFMAENINTVEDLLRQQRFLCKAANIGRVSLIHIKIELLKYGIEFDFTPAPRQMKLL